MGELSVPNFMPDSTKPTPEETVKKKASEPTENEKLRAQVRLNIEEEEREGLDTGSARDREESY